MGFVRPDPDVESWLTEAAASWRQLSDPEMRAILARWRRVFESELLDGRFVKHGKHAEAAMAEELPTDAWVFNIPGNRLFPPGPSAAEGQYAYFAAKLRTIDRVAANRANAIVTTAAFRTTCLFTHEAGAMGEPACVALEGEDSRDLVEG